ncbi:MAG: alpha/beta hydrolase family protein, partial [Bacteroidia bacterium]
EFTALWYADSLYVACQQYQPDILIGHSAGGMASLFLLTHFQVSSIQQVVCLGAPSDVANVLEKFSNFLGLWQPTRKVLTAYFEDIFQKPVAYYSMANFVKELKVSGIIVHDEEDKDVPFSEGGKIARNYVAAEFIRTKGLGHSLNDTQLIKQIVGKLKKD